MSSKLQLAPLGNRFWFCTPGSECEFDTAFAVLVEQRVRALLIGADPFFTASRERLVALAARHAIPAIYELRDYTVADGLMSYGRQWRSNHAGVGHLGSRRPEDH
jgi:putative tryptophan/tyrosine transport system substrate-binding protein